MDLQFARGHGPRKRSVLNRDSTYHGNATANEHGKQSEVDGAHSMTTYRIVRRRSMQRGKVENLREERSEGVPIQ